jgi:5-methyltetrahydropteroyltriglutamate--homocysteine methyltransferase
MKRSTDRILTKPVGSLHRPAHLTELLWAKERGEQVDPAVLFAEIQSAVASAVSMQAGCRMDYLSDGEMGKLSFMTYQYQRLSGYGGPENNFQPPDIAAFPGSEERYEEAGPHPGIRMNDGPVRLVNPQAALTDIENLRLALARVPYQEAFVCSVSPGAATGGGTSYYNAEEQFLHDIAQAMLPEYRAIIDAGFVLQLDLPDIPMVGTFMPGQRDAFRYAVAPRIEVLREVMTRLDAPDRIVVHACWGNWPGPHSFDTPLNWFMDLLLALPCQGISIEATTRTHDADWHVFQDPAMAGPFRSGEKILFVGLIDTKAPALESAEGIADRLELYARLLGRENVVASTDCGFGTFLGRKVITPELAQAKLTRLADGAELASRRLWPAAASE